MATKPDTKSILADKIRFLQELQRGNFDPKKKREEIKDREDQINTLQGEIIEIKGALAAYYNATDQPAPTDDESLTDDQVEEKVRAVMASYPSGANGKEIAKTIGDFRITSETISDLYWREGQTVLRKEGVAANTKYRLATADDAAAITEAKRKEEEQIAAMKAKREAKKK